MKKLKPILFLLSLLVLWPATELSAKVSTASPQSVFEADALMQQFFEDNKTPGLALLNFHTAWFQRTPNRYSGPGRRPVQEKQPAMLLAGESVSTTKADGGSGMVAALWAAQPNFTSCRKAAWLSP